MLRRQRRPRWYRASELDKLVASLNKSEVRARRAREALARIAFVCDNASWAKTVGIERAAFDALEEARKLAIAGMRDSRIEL